MELTSNVESITDLFARDPETWVEADMVRMVEHYRKTRQQLDSAEVKVRGAKKPAAPKIAVEDLKGKDGAGLLGALGIDL